MMRQFLREGEWLEGEWQAGGSLSGLGKRPGFGSTSLSSTSMAVISSRALISISSMSHETRYCCSWCGVSWSVLPLVKAWMGWRSRRLRSSGCADRAGRMGGVFSSSLALGSEERERSGEGSEVGSAGGHRGSEKKSLRAGRMGHLLQKIMSEASRVLLPLFLPSQSCPFFCSNPFGLIIAKREQNIGILKQTKIKKPPSPSNNHQDAFLRGENNLDGCWSGKWRCEAGTRGKIKWKQVIIQYYQVINHTVIWKQFHHLTLILYLSRPHPKNTSKYYRNFNQLYYASPPSSHPCFDLATSRRGSKHKIQEQQNHKYNRFSPTEESGSASMQSTSHRAFSQSGCGVASQ